MDTQPGSGQPAQASRQLGPRAERAKKFFGGIYHDQPAFFNLLHVCNPSEKTNFTANVSRIALCIAMFLVTEGPVDG